MKTPSSQGVCRVLIVDDHAIFRRGLVSIVEQAKGLAVAGEAANGEEAVAAYRKLKPDIALVDLQMPGVDGFETLLRIRHNDPAAKVVILTMLNTDDDINHVLRAGARAYLLKDASPDDIVQCIRDVCEGRTRVSPDIAARLADRFTMVQLTPREHSVLGHVAEGLNNAAIGERLRITEGTVKVHVAHLFDKLGAKSRTDLVAIGVRRGLVRMKSG
jgi:two-component system NarL family response regulator